MLGGVNDKKGRIFKRFFRRLNGLNDKKGRISGDNPTHPTHPTYPRNGVTAGRSEPGNRAHTFRMTLVAQGKIPQKIYLIIFTLDANRDRAQINEIKFIKFLLF